MGDLLPLGTRVTFDQADVLTREYVDLTERDRQTRHRPGVRRKAWQSIRERLPRHSWYLRTMSGIVVGARSLQDGTTEWDPDYGVTFYADGRVPVYLIATGLHDGLVRVRRDAVTPEATTKAPEGPTTLADAVREQARGHLGASSPPR